MWVWLAVVYVLGAFTFFLTRRALFSSPSYGKSCPALTASQELTPPETLKEQFSSRSFEGRPSPALPLPFLESSGGSLLSKKNSSSMRKVKSAHDMLVQQLEASDRASPPRIFSSPRAEEPSHRVSILHKEPEIRNPVDPTHSPSRKKKRRPRSRSARYVDTRSRHSVRPLKELTRREGSDISNESPPTSVILPPLLLPSSPPPSSSPPDHDDLPRPEEPQPEEPSPREAKNEIDSARDLMHLLFSLGEKVRHKNETSGASPSQENSPHTQRKKKTHKRSSSDSEKSTFKRLSKSLKRIRTNSHEPIVMPRSRQQVLQSAEKMGWMRVSHSPFVTLRDKTSWSKRFLILCPGELYLMRSQEVRSPCLPCS